MNSEEILAQIEFESVKSTAKVREMLIEAGRPDLLADFDQRIREIRLGTLQARNIWHSISPAQRRVLEIMSTGRRLFRRQGSRTRYDALGEPEAVGNVCGITTVRNLTARELCTVDGGAFDPERKIVLTEHGQFVLRHGRTSDAAAVAQR